MKKIIFIFERKYGYETDKKVFGLDYYKSVGFDVEVWSLADWTFNHKSEDRPNNIDLSGLTIYINDYNEFIKNFERIKNTDCFFLIYPYHAYTDVSFCIRKTIKINNFEYINIHETPVNYSNAFDSFLFLIIYYLIKEIGSIIKAISYIFLDFNIFKIKIRIIVKKIIGPKLYKSKYNIVPTKYSLYLMPCLSEALSRRNIFTHSETYDDWLNASEFDKYGNYILYIDQGLTVNDDFKRNYKLQVINDSNVYLKSLVNLFDIISNDYSCDIIIAVHPKAMYNGNEFGDYKMIKNRTNSLIKNSKFVIIETSTCLGQIVLNNKPFLNIYCDDIINNSVSLKNVYKQIKKSFNCKQLNIYNSNEIQNYKDYVYYSAKCYKKFIDNIIFFDKSLKTKKLTSSIIVDLINAI